MTNQIDYSVGDNSLRNETVDDFLKQVMGSLRQCQVHSNEIQGWHHFSDYKGVRLTMNKINYSINSLINKIYNHEDVKVNLLGHNLLKQFDILKEGNDTVLERVASDLDEASGIQRSYVTDIADTTLCTVRGTVNNIQGQEMVLLASRNVQKPQLFFTTPINNSTKEPFISTLKEKPNSLKPLSIMLCTDKNGREYYSHPYEYELEHWSPSESAFELKDPIEPISIVKTPLELIETEQQLQRMIKELKKCPEIAVDVENHQFRSYQGLTCLIQISSRKKDYIIDPFPLRGRLEELNVIFTDPKITKVFHGADLDILWLQRDCDLYVVNMFDTHQAAVMLNYSHRSLAALLQKFCSITINKTYQRADWRIRPLPQDFITYARQDTHYLLYIYDLLRNQLLEVVEEDKLQTVYSRSTQICLKRYEKPLGGEEIYLDIYYRSRKDFNNQQLWALQNLCIWRDKIAKEQDESVDYVLPKHMMLQIAEILPKEAQGILACCNPIPACVKSEQIILHQIVKEARLQPLTKVLDDRSEFTNHPIIPSEPSLSNRHDLSQTEEFGAGGMSTLLNPFGAISVDSFSHNEKKSKSTLFGITQKLLSRSGSVMTRVTNDEYITPFERYKMYLELCSVQNQQSAEHSPSQTPPNEEKDLDRIKKIHEHFVNLNKSGGEVEEETVSLLNTNSGNHTKKAKKRASDKNKICSGREKRKHEEKDNVDSSVLVGGQTGKIEARNKKGNKKMKKSEGSSVIPSEEPPQNCLDDHAEDAHSEDVLVTPFDYKSANYSIFKSRKNSKSKKNKIKEKFKSKKNAKTTGKQKSGLKSICWGNKK